MTDPFQIPPELAQELAEAITPIMRKLFVAWQPELEMHERQLEALEAMEGWDWSQPTFPDDPEYDIAELRAHTEYLASVNPPLRAALDAADAESARHLPQAKLDAMSDQELVDLAHQIGEEGDERDGDGH